MWKIGILISLVLFTIPLSDIQAQKIRTLTNGFSVNLITGFPSTSFGAENSSDFPSEMQYNAFGVLSWVIAGTLILKRNMVLA